MLYVILLIPGLLLAANDFAEPNPSEVLIVYNRNSTLDTDGDGIYDHREIINKLWQVRRDTSNILGIATEISYNTEYQAQSVHIDLLHYDMDTSDTYGNNTSISVGSGEYIIQEIAQWFDADSANRWGKVVYIELLMGMPVKVRGNDNYGLLPANEPTLYRSLASYIWVHLRPGIENNGSMTEHMEYGHAGSPNPRIENPYKRQVDSTGVWDFVPGILKVAFGVIGYTDSLPLWVALPTLLDGNNVNDVLGMIDRSEHQIFQAGGTSRSDIWAVVDETDTTAGLDPYLNPFQTVAGVSETLDVEFPSRVLYDVDSVGLGGSSAEYVGWPGNVTLQNGDSCGFLFTAGSKHHPQPSHPEQWFYNLDFPIAPGAVALASESYFAYTMRDTSLREPANGDQPLACEAIANGFTYALGNCFEPGTGGIVRVKSIVNGMMIPHLPFAIMASASFPYAYFSNIAVGPAIGYFRPALTASSETVTISGVCSEAVSYSGTMPGSADSVLFTRITVSSETLTTRVNTSPGGSVNHTISNLWRDKPLDKVLVTIIDTVGVHHTTEFIAP